VPHTIYFKEASLYRGSCEAFYLRGAASQVRLGQHFPDGICDNHWRAGCSELKNRTVG
jgi:hypothetical protein